MKGFLKQNFVLVVGIALPVVLMAFFYIAGRISVAGIDPPQYDAVFAVNYIEHGPNQPYKIGIDNGNLVIRCNPKDDETGRHYKKPQIYVFDHVAHDARLLDIDFDNVEDGLVKDPDIDVLNQKRLIPDPTSPDGYHFEHPSRSSGVGLVRGLFGMARYRNDYVLKNGARVVAVKGPQRSRQAHFIAWIGK